MSNEACVWRNECKDKKIQILSQVVTRDAQGIGTTTLQPVGSPVWAYFRQLSGKERFAAATTVSEEEVLFTINYRTDINTTHIIRYKGKLYDITRVDVFEGYKEDITLYCKTRAR